MSSYGIMTTRMMEEQRERERLDRVVLECQRMDHEVLGRIAKVLADNVFIEIHATMEQLDLRRVTAVNEVGRDPDAALRALKEIGRSVIDEETAVKARHQKLANDLAKQMTAVESAIVEISSLPLKDPSHQKELTMLVRDLDRIRVSGRVVSNYDDIVVKTTESAHSLMRAEIEEEERRSVVKELSGALKKNGYFVSKPLVKNDVVTLVATDSSGRKVVFNVRKGGNVHFDFEGYSGDSCRQNLDAVITKLNEGGTLKGEIEEFVWHNPDRLKKGAKDAPTGVAQVRSKGG